MASRPLSAIYGIYSIRLTWCGRGRLAIVGATNDNLLASLCCGSSMPEMTAGGQSHRLSTVGFERQPQRLRRDPGRICNSRRARGLATTCSGACSRNASRSDGDHWQRVGPSVAAVVGQGQCRQTRTCNVQGTQRSGGERACNLMVQRAHGDASHTISLAVSLTRTSRPPPHRSFQFGASGCRAAARANPRRQTCSRPGFPLLLAVRSSTAPTFFAGRPRQDRSLLSSCPASRRTSSCPPTLLPQRWCFGPELTA